MSGIMLARFSEDATPSRSSESQASSTWPISAISAMEQPALRSGRITCCHPCASTSADSAMKWTPQKMRYLALVSLAILLSL